MRRLVAFLTRLFNRLDVYLFPLLLLAMRIWIAHIFWKSGYHKIRHWGATISLFKYEYKVPLINPEIAAYLTTTFELVCPVLLVFGLMTRIATLPLIVMTAVMQFTYISLEAHLFWTFILGTLLLKGAGPLSLDDLIFRRARSRVKVMGV
ncbi:MAG: DoxX family protein [Alphaproteobacteria bacterium]|jgi:putative oxidoreductase|nr:DoxX family protein [Alphaproteobacteria bacterium]